MTRSAALLALLFSALGGVCSAQAKAQVPAPKDVIGFVPGTDGLLADYDQIVEYFRALAKASPRVDLQFVGETTEKQPLALAVISSQENMERIEEIRRDNARLTDPRKLPPAEAAKIIAKGKTIVLLNESIHSNEVGPAQASMLTAHFLASTQEARWKEVLDNVVLLLTPCHNPDGYRTVVNWWNKTRTNEDTRGAPLPVLYHKYVGHDNNRDWFMLTQQESRLTVEKLHQHWFPQIVIDQHQMGSQGARMFVPPYIEPYEPNVHPLLKKQLEDLGRSVVKGMTGQGLTGVWCNRQFDAWTPARAYMHYHGAVRVLNEVASVRTADPIENSPRPRGDAGTKSKDNPSPWKGGRWALEDILTYCKEGALHAVKHASDHRQTWLKNFYQIHKDNCDTREGPWGFVIPADQPRHAALEKFLDIMKLGGVETQLVSLQGTTPKDFVNLSPHLPPVSAGPAWLIKNGQPYFCFARALFENTPYPEIRTGPGGSIRRPYDVTSHCLPLLMSLQVGLSPRELKVEPLSMDVAATGNTSTEFLLDPRDEHALTDAVRLLQSGADIERVPTPSGVLPAGALRVRTESPPAGLVSQTHQVPKGLGQGIPLKSRRVGVYWSYTANMDEGWTRFFFDFLKVPFTPLRNTDMRAGKLNDRVDVIVFADIRTTSIVAGQVSRRLPEEFRGGIGSEGQTALKEFVTGGGTLVTMGSSSRFAIDLFDLPMTTVRTFRGFDRDPGDETEGENPPRGQGGRGRGERGGRGRGPGLSVPGSMLWADVAADHPLTHGLPARLPVWYWRSTAFERTGDGVTFPVTFAAKDQRAGGFAEGTEILANKGVLAHASVGQGNIVLFSVSPQFRCQTWGTFPLLLNALLLPPRAQ